MDIIIIKGAPDNNYKRILSQKDRCNLFSYISDDNESPAVAKFLLMLLPCFLIFYIFLDTNQALCDSSNIRIST